MDTNASAIIGKTENADYCCMSSTIWRCSFFQDKFGRYHCILAYNFVLYITCSYVLENYYIFKVLLPQNETLATPLANAQLIYMNKFLFILSLPLP